MPKVESFEGNTAILKFNRETTTPNLIYFSWISIDNDLVSGKLINILLRIQAGVVQCGVFTVKSNLLKEFKDVIKFSPPFTLPPKFIRGNNNNKNN